MNLLSESWMTLMSRLLSLLCGKLRSSLMLKVQLVVEVGAGLHGNAVGFGIELLVAELGLRYINWWFFLMKLR